MSEPTPETASLWCVYEHASGIVWTVDPPTRENAEREAALADKGLDYRAHTPLPAAQAEAMGNAWAHGRMAAITEQRQSGAVPVARAVLRDVLQQRVLSAIVNADCYCRPGDPTCADWPDSESRWRAQADAVVRVLCQEPQPPADPLPYPTDPEDRAHVEYMSGTGPDPLNPKPTAPIKAATYDDVATRGRHTP